MNKLKKCLKSELERLERSGNDYRYLINSVSVALSNVCEHLNGDSQVELELKVLSKHINKLPATSVFSDAKRFDNYYNELQAIEIRNKAIDLLRTIIKL